ncbi:hypothetical protein HPP92_004920 [Vanilla planifolia]|uniref:Uncharacterized protein n=1 Tax=Vanilla planifolia TaxID=51239 RepID=A0A835RKR0_VANPL|nr:hypothetical protein HPP92_004920 [Vanilla planifolia]
MMGTSTPLPHAWEKDYNRSEMRRMIACAMAAMRHSAKQKASRIPGDASLEDLNEGVKPGAQQCLWFLYESSDYDTMQYKEDMKRFRENSIGKPGTRGSGYSVLPTGELGLNQSASVAKVEML